MGRPNPQTMGKRQREQAKKDKRRDKDARRAARKAARVAASAPTAGRPPVDAGVAEIDSATRKAAHPIR